jgi:hypothetical protein
MWIWCNTEPEVSCKARFVLVNVVESFPFIDGSSDGNHNKDDPLTDTLYERFRYTDILDDGEVVELDGIHAETERWLEVIADEPSFASWRIAHLPSGWTVAVEPIRVCLPRFLATCPNASRGLAGGN